MPLRSTIFATNVGVSQHFQLMSKTKENKVISKVCIETFASELEAFGYLPHPAYKAGWEASHQEYECNWLKEDLSQGIDEISMTWTPKDRLVRISRLLAHPQLPKNFAFPDITTAPFEFNYFLVNPYVRFTLMPLPRRFWHFRKMDLKLLPSEIAYPEKVKEPLKKYVIPCLPALLQAKDNTVKDKSLCIDNFDMVVQSD